MPLLEQQEYLDRRIIVVIFISQLIYINDYYSYPIEYIESFSTVRAKKKKLPSEY